MESGGGARLGAGRLQDIGVFVVEDEFIVAFDMQAMLEEEGARVIGPAAGLEDALATFRQAKGAVRVAVLDVNLNGEYVFPLARELRGSGIPFVFATAYADDDRLFPTDLLDVPRLAKPVTQSVLVMQVLRLLGQE